MPPIPVRNSTQRAEMMRMPATQEERRLFGLFGRKKQSKEETLEQLTKDVARVLADLEALKGGK